MSKNQNTTLEVEATELKEAMGQRLMLTFDAAKPFTHKNEDGTELKLQRVYHLNVPYLSPFEEIYQVLEDFKKEVKRQEQVSKENAAKARKEQEAKAEQEKQAELIANK